MKTSAIEVHDMLSVFSVDEVEKRIGEVPGVQSVTVNFAAGNATVRYDETQLEASDIKSAVRQRGFDAPLPAAAASAEGQAAHAPLAATDAPNSVAASADTAPPEKAAPSTAPNVPPAVPVDAPAGDAQPVEGAAEKG
jgi:copper chaperone CopZ